MINFIDDIEPESPDKVDQPIDDIKPFPDLRSAGRELALKLEPYRQRHDVVVLAILLGGTLVAHEVASFLGAPLDLVIIRRLFMPQGPGSQVCAVSVGGSMVFDKELVPHTSTPSTPVEHFVAGAIAELKGREQTSRRGRPPIDLTGKTVILVDCGIRSSLTMRAAIEALRTKEPEKVVAAVPVSSLGGHAAIAAMADEIVCLAQPKPFVHVGVWYTDFTRPGDDAVGELLESGRVRG